MCEFIVCIFLKSWWLKFIFSKYLNLLFQNSCILRNVRTYSYSSEQIFQRNCFSGDHLLPKNKSSIHLKQFSVLVRWFDENLLLLLFRKSNVRLKTFYNYTQHSTMMILNDVIIIVKMPLSKNDCKQLQKKKSAEKEFGWFGWCGFSRRTDIDDFDGKLLPKVIQSSGRNWINSIKVQQPIFIKWIYPLF